MNGSGTQYQLAAWQSAGPPDRIQRPKSALPSLTPWAASANGAAGPSSQTVGELAAAGAAAKPSAGGDMAGCQGNTTSTAGYGQFKGMLNFRNC